MKVFFYGTTSSRIFVFQFCMYASPIEYVTSYYVMREKFRRKSLLPSEAAARHFFITSDDVEIENMLEFPVTCCFQHPETQRKLDVVDVARKNSLHNTDDERKASDYSELRHYISSYYVHRLSNNLRNFEFLSV